LDPAPDGVDRLVARDGDQPAARLVGRALGRPAREGGGERVLDRLLGEVEVAVGHADRRREHAGALVAKYGFDRRGALHALILARTAALGRRRDGAEISY